MKLNTLLAEIADATPEVLVKTTVNSEVQRFSQGRVTELLTVLEPFTATLNKVVEELQTRSAGPDKTDFTIEVAEEMTSTNVTVDSQPVKPTYVTIAMEKFLDESARYVIFRHKDSGEKVFIPKFALMEEVEQQDGTINVTVTRRFLEETGQPVLQALLKN